MTLRLREDSLKDPQIKELSKGVLLWWDRFVSNDRPCWLTLCGTTEVGKTHCADRIWAEAGRINRIKPAFDASEYYPSKIWWVDFVNELRSGKAYDKAADMKRWPLLYIDEIGASRDTTGYVSDQLYAILGARDGKWTIITTNLTYEQLGVMDERIANRCIRNNGIVVTVNTVPFSSRGEA